MLDFGRIVGFDWDPGNAHKSVSKHGVDQPEAEQLFFNDPLLILDDSAHSEEEPRFHALGRSEAGRLLHATFTLRQDGALIRVISVRDMSRKERMRYAEEA
jgi:uncharacterized DUF497 family protein